MKRLKFAIASLLLASLNLQADLPEILDNSAHISAHCGDETSHHHFSRKKTTANHTSNTNVFVVPTAIASGSSIPFNGVPVESGAVIQSSLDTFTIYESGHYYVNATISPTFPTTGAGIIFEVDGALYGTGTSVAFGDTPHILQQIIPIIAAPGKPATIRVLVSGTVSMNFPEGQAASISIFQLSKTGNL